MARCAHSMPISGLSHRSTTWAPNLARYQSMPSWRSGTMRAIWSSAGTWPMAPRGRLLFVISFLSLDLRMSVGHRGPGPLGADGSKNCVDDAGGARPILERWQARHLFAPHLCIGVGNKGVETVLVALRMPRGQHGIPGGFAAQVL